MMSINRRSFFGVVLGGFAAAVAPKPATMYLQNGPRVFFGNGAEYWIPERLTDGDSEYPKTTLGRRTALEHAHMLGYIPRDSV